MSEKPDDSGLTPPAGKLREPGYSGNERLQAGDRRPENQKEWRIIEKLLLRQFDEQKKARRWNMLFKFGIIAYLFFALFLFRGGFGGSLSTGGATEHTAMVRVDGMIADDHEANADNIVSGLREAFEASQAKAVLLKINSPGGSPVQSGMVYREILRLRELYPEKKVYAVITDVGASGAYYIAAAANEIYADPASIVGSIGVISDSFGFTGAMEKLGVERRVYHAGDNKAMLDPFSKVDPQQKQKFQAVLTTVHQQFIDAVKKGRGERLQASPEIFSGLFWSGQQALPLGLIDGLGSPGQVAREQIGHEDIVDYTQSMNPLQGLVDRLGVSIGKTIVSLAGIGGLSLK